MAVSKTPRKPTKAASKAAKATKAAPKPDDSDAVHRAVMSLPEGVDADIVGFMVDADPAGIDDDPASGGPLSDESADPGTILVILDPSDPTDTPVELAAFPEPARPAPTMVITSDGPVVRPTVVEPVRPPATDPDDWKMTLSRSQRRQLLGQRPG